MCRRQIGRDFPYASCSVYVAYLRVNTQNFRFGIRMRRSVLVIAGTAHYTTCMKRITFYLSAIYLFIISVSSTVSQEPPVQTRARADFDLRGPVKTLVELDANYDVTLELEFDSAGRLAEEKSYGNATAYEYDQDGRLVRFTIRSSGRRTREWTISYERDGTTVIDSSYHYSSGDLTGKTETKNDSLGRMISQKKYDANGLTHDWQAEYGTEKTIVTIRTYDSSTGYRQSNTTMEISGTEYNPDTLRIDETAIITEGWNQPSDISIRYSSGNYRENLDFAAGGRLKNESRRMYNSRDYLGSGPRWEYSYNDSGLVESAGFYRSRYSDPVSWEVEYENSVPVLVRRYDRDEKLEATRRYAYDDQNRLTSQIADTYGEKGELLYRWTTHFDSSGNIVKREYRHESKSFTKTWVYEYDDERRLIDETSYDTTGRVLTTRSIGFDDRGVRFAETTNLLGEQIRTWRGTQNTYDENDRIIESIWHYENGEMSGRRLYEYDDDGRILQDIIYDPDGAMTARTQNEYNDSGLLSIRTVYSADNYVSQRFTYDYQYDSRGNWISKREYRDDNTLEKYGILSYTQKRTITYY